MQDLRPEVDRMWRAGRYRQRRDPVVAVPTSAGPGAVGRVGPGRDVLHLTRRRVPARQPAAETGAIDDPGIRGVGHVAVALVAANRMPVAEGDLPVVAARDDPDRPRV